MTDLQEVRRYWPQFRVEWGHHTRLDRWFDTRYNGLYMTVKDGWIWANRELRKRRRFPENRRRIKKRTYGIGAGTWRPPCAGEGQTLAEAMRAAGFGVRAQGLRQVMNSLKRNDCTGRILPGPRIKPHKWFVELRSTQRPRKGARLGRGKRREAATKAVKACRFRRWGLADARIVRRVRDVL